MEFIKQMKFEKFKLEYSDHRWFSKKESTLKVLVCKNKYTFKRNFEKTLHEI